MMTARKKKRKKIAMVMGEEKVEDERESVKNRRGGMMDRWVRRKRESENK